MNVIFYAMFGTYELGSYAFTTNILIYFDIFTHFYPNKQKSFFDNRVFSVHHLFRTALSDLSKKKLLRSELLTWHALEGIGLGRAPDETPPKEQGIVGYKSTPGGNLRCGNRF